MSAARGAILVIGATGQIGQEMARGLSELGTIVAPSRRDLDLDHDSSIVQFLQTARPSLVVNAAAYTAVDRAESDVAACARVNAAAPATIAAECARLDAALVHLSTDYVFDGSARTPYTETDHTNPSNVYGRTKRDGEIGVIASGCAHLILRTSWIYAARDKNFALTMLQLARERVELSVVDDQIGAPTTARAVALGAVDILRSLALEGTWANAIGRASGIYHMTADGSTSWHGFAQRILADDPRRSEQTCRVVHPIPSSDYPTPARRPAYSVLDNSKLAGRFGVRLPHWTDQWSGTVSELRINWPLAFPRETAARRADPPTA